MKFIVATTPYPETNFGIGNFCGTLVEGDARGNYFIDAPTGQYRCWDGKVWTVRPDLSSGCFFFFNGILATYNPEEPGSPSNGVSEFRASRIPNA